MSSGLEYLDAGIFIASIDREHIAHRECGDLLLGLMSENRALTSLATLEEVIHRIKAKKCADEFIDMLLRSPRLVKIPLNIEILMKSANVVFRYGIDAFDAVAISTALIHGASVFWTVDIRLLDCIDALRETWAELSRIEFRCPINPKLLMEESKIKHQQKAKRNIENAILNLLYVRGLKIKKNRFRQAVEETLKTIETIINKYI